MEVNKLLTLILMGLGFNAWAAEYSYIDPSYGTVILDLNYAPEGLYLYASIDDLYDNLYVTPNAYKFTQHFTEKDREYVVESVWELTNRGEVAFYLDEQQDFPITGGHLKVQAHQNFVNLEGLINPLLWPEILDQFLLYRNFSLRKKTYLDIFEKVFLSPAGFNELDGDVDAVYNYEASWLTNILGPLGGEEVPEKIAGLESALAADASGEESIYIWLSRIKASRKLYKLTTHLKEVNDSGVDGLGDFLDGVGVIFEAFLNANCPVPSGYKPSLQINQADSSATASAPGWA